MKVAATMSMALAGPRQRGPGPIWCAGLPPTHPASTPSTQAGPKCHGQDTEGEAGQVVRRGGTHHALTGPFWRFHWEVRKQAQHRFGTATHHLCPAALLPLTTAREGVEQHFAGFAALSPALH